MLSKKTRRLVYAVYPRIPPNTPLDTSDFCHCNWHFELKLYLLFVNYRMGHKISLVCSMLVLISVCNQIVCIVIPTFFLSHFCFVSKVFNDSFIILLYHCFSLKSTSLMEK